MPKRRIRSIHVATIAVVLGVAVGASVVFAIGSAQRRDDRAAYLAYERAVLIPLREGGRITQQEMKPSLTQLRNGSIELSDALARAAAWRSAFGTVRREVLSLDAPSFLRGIDTKWRAALERYLEVPALFERAARASGAARAALLDAAADAGDRADDLFDRAAAVMQAHRRRLGLGPSHDLPDPDAAP